MYICSLPCPHLFLVLTYPWSSPLATLQFHFYAYDSSLYITFEPSDMDASLEKVEQCIASVRDQMSAMSFKLNDSESEVTLITTKHMHREIPGILTLHVGDADVEASEVVPLL